MRALKAFWSLIKQTAACWIDHQDWSRRLAAFAHSG
jgi:hypothetical protein